MLKIHETQRTIITLYSCQLTLLTNSPTEYWLPRGRLYTSVAAAGYPWCLCAFCSSVLYSILFSRRIDGRIFFSVRRLRISRAYETRIVHLFGNRKNPKACKSFIYSKSRCATHLPSRDYNTIYITICVYMYIVYNTYTNNISAYCAYCPRATSLVH